MSWRQSIAVTLLVGLLTVTGLWVLVLVAAPISGAFSLMAQKRRQEAAAKTERDAGQGVVPWNRLRFWCHSNGGLDSNTPKGRTGGC